MTLSIEIELGHDLAESAVDLTEYPRNVREAFFSELADMISDDIGLRYGDGNTIDVTYREESPMLGGEPTLVVVSSCGADVSQLETESQIADAIEDDVRAIAADFFSDVDGLEEIASEYGAA